MASQVEICNMALSRVGSSRLIESLSDQCVEAEQANLWWEPVLSDVVVRFPWPFAKKRQVLTLSGGSASDYDYVYTLPSDCLHPLRITIPGIPEPRADERPVFTVEGPYLLTNTEDAELLYVTNQADPNLFPKDFTYAFVALLASKFAASLPKDMALAARLEQEGEFKLRLGAARGANMGQPGVPAVSSFEASRG